MTTLTNRPASSSRPRSRRSAAWSASFTATCRGRCAGSTTCRCSPIWPTLRPWRPIERYVRGVPGGRGGAAKAKAHVPPRPGQVRAKLRHEEGIMLDTESCFPSPFASCSGRRTSSAAGRRGKMGTRSRWPKVKTDYGRAGELVKSAQAQWQELAYSIHREAIVTMPTGALVMWRRPTDSIAGRLRACGRPVRSSRARCGRITTSPTSTRPGRRNGGTSICAT